MTALADALVDRLTRVSAFMQAVTNDLSDAELRAQFDPEFSPIGWHLGHVAWQEENWVLRGFAGHAPLEPRFDEVFDAFRPHKAERSARIPPKQVLLGYRTRVRDKVLRCLDRLLEDESNALMRGANLLRCVANHESQHTETVLCMRLAGALPLARDVLSNAPVQDEARTPELVVIPGGSLSMGTAQDPERWDNEAAPHRVEVAPFLCRRTLITNAEWLEFVAAGAYREQRWWCDAGRRFLREHRIEAPLYWHRDATGAWQERTLFGDEPLVLDRPVRHVSWFEAQAFARFSGARLLSEAEWEWVARGPVANGGAGKGAAKGAAKGVCQLTGSAWQWTSDWFEPYPGFVPQPYQGYSLPWFGATHRVARGGAFVTAAEIARPTFRNWYHPGMRRAFLGVRLASEAA